MGYCEGGDLSSRLRSYHGNLLPETQVVEWFVQIALALQVRLLVGACEHVCMAACLSLCSTFMTRIFCIEI